jgi:lysophospholipase L1-like esterase
VIVAEGNSITHGGAWVSQMMGYLPSFEYHNVAEDGAQIPAITTDYATQVLPLHDSQRYENVLVIWMGTNDMHALASTLEPLYVTYVDRAIADGWKVVVVAVEPSTQYDTDDEAHRVDLNARLQARYASNHTPGAAFANTLTVPETADPTNVTYYPDGVHPSATLHALTTPVVRDAILSLLDPHTSP